MSECHCDDWYEGCPIHCDRCKKDLESDIKPSCPPLCNECYKYVFGK